jgi:hypothetical protein
MAPSRWEEFRNLHRNAINIGIIVVLLSILALGVYLEYVFEYSPEAKEPLLIHMNSLCLSNNSVEWRVEFTFENIADDYDVSISRLETYLFYGGDVWCPMVEPIINLRARRQKKVLLKFRPSNTSTSVCPGKLPDTAEQALKASREATRKNHVHASLEMKMRFQEYQNRALKSDLNLLVVCVESPLPGATNGNNIIMDSFQDCFIKW